MMTGTQSPLDLSALISAALSLCSDSVIHGVNGEFYILLTSKGVYISEELNSGLSMDRLGELSSGQKVRKR